MPVLKACGEYGRALACTGVGEKCTAEGPQKGKLVAYRKGGSPQARAASCTVPQLAHQNSEFIKSPYLDQFLTKHPNWHVTFSENGWTSNDITIEWLEKVFSPETESGDSADARLLIVDGHGSHTSDEFMTICCLNNIYLLFLPAHTSHVLQPLDLGWFSSLRTAYQGLMTSIQP